MASERGRKPDRDEPGYSSIAGFTDPIDPLHREAMRKGAARRAQARRLAAEDEQEPLHDHPRRPRRTRMQRFRRLVLALFIVFFCVPALLFFAVYWSADIPEPGEVAVEQPAIIYASDGTSVLTKIIPPQGNRVPIPLSDVPIPVRDAVLAAEDRNFYTNPGYSTSGFLRAARDNVLGHDNAGGGSTITQQYVKNAFLSSERTITRKMRELIIAAKMSRQWSKDEILSAYLNTIYYGRGAYGIASAATAYFGKPVPELSLAEGAVLASLIRSPSILDPETHGDQLRTRWEYVLNGMVEMGVLAPGDRDATIFPAIIPASDVPTDTTQLGPEGLVRAQVLAELRAAGFTDTDINTGGLQITTTIDLAAQNGAQAAVRGSTAWQPAELRSAVVSIDPRSGAVRAYYGGEDGLGFDFAQAPLQAGSSFKVFALIAAVRQGIPITRNLDSSPIKDRNTTITNVGNESCGQCSMAEALKRSLNTSFYRLTMTMGDGPNAIASAAHDAGIPEYIPGLDYETLTEAGAPPLNGIVLGQYEVRAIDMASAYATIAADGVYHQPYFVQKVTTSYGEVLLDRGIPEERVGRQPDGPDQRITSGVARAATQAMLPIAAYSNGHALADGRPSAAKTGTTQLGDTKFNKDAWMIGFTPSLSTAVWVGTENPQPLKNGRGADIYGSGLPSDIWKQTMDAALAGTPIEQFDVAPLPEPTPPPAPSRGFDIFNPPTTRRTQPPMIIIPPPPTMPFAPSQPDESPPPTEPSQQEEWFPGIGGNGGR
ncbi:penicillin-binding protein [Nocardia camponoti]|uniref:Penicillin-binding protein n=1 Tax=Nocardia camponoti TaxID=1616106 RepID=A0A917QJP1_9NOCA|nr:penicillin-binding protein [Nocardia camponoti]